MKVLVLVLSIVFLSFSAPPELYAVEDTAQEEGPGVSIPTLGNQHISSLRAPHAPYNSVPPTSGPHTHNVAQWGVYRQQVPDELQVHNLEDGGVLVQYDCRGCKDLMKQLEGLVRSYYKKAKTEEKESGGRSKYQHIIVGPYKNIGNTIALTAWGRIDKFDEFDEDRIRRFIEAYVGIDHHPR